MTAAPPRPASPRATPAAPPHPDGGPVVRNAAANGAGYVVRIAVAFFMTPFLVRHLGEDRYGTWILVNSLAGYLGVLEFGLQLAVKRFVAAHLARAGGRLEATITTAVSALAIAGGVALAGTGALVLSAGSLAVPAEDLAAVRLALALAGVTVAISLPCAVHTATLSGIQRYDVSNAIAIGGLAVRTAAIIVAARSGLGVVSLALIQGGSLLATCAVQVAALRRLLPGVRLGPRRVDRRALRELFGYGKWSFALDVADRLTIYAGATVLGFLHEVSAIAAFTVAFQLVEYARQLVSSLVAVLMPAFGDLEARADPARLRAAFIRGSRGAAIVVFPIALGLALCGERFLALWMGADMAARAGPLLVALAAPLPLILPQHVAQSLLLGVSRHRPFAICSLAQAGVTAALAAALVGPLGPLGVALGVSIPLAVMSAIFYPIVAGRIVGIAPARYLRETIGPPALLAVPLAAAYAALRGWEPAGILPFFGVMGAIAAPYAAVAWKLAIGRPPGPRTASLEMTAV